MSKAVNEKWKKTFPDTLGNQNRPAEGVDDTQPFETGAFPQYMANDPVRYDLQNAAMSQSMSNDARLKEMVDARGKELDDHKVDPGAHKTGIAGNAATATKVVTNAASGASANIAEASMASSDSARIRVSGANNAGELALETADDGNEAIVARQYTGDFKDVARTAAILDANGNTSFPGTVVAPKFTGALNGNAATASKLLTPRTLSLTGKAAGSTSFDGSANAVINVTSVNADTASKLSTARKINITGNATGAAAFDGSGDVSINVTVNESKHAAAATTVNATAPNGGAADLAFGTMAINDYARIRVYGKDDNGELEIATADAGTEPIYARQYSGAYDWLYGRPGTVANEAAILDSNGNTKFPKNVTAASFTGPLNGNADSATTAAACSGNSATATKLQTPRTISLTGNASGSANFDGSSDVSINVNVNESKHAGSAGTLQSSAATETSTVALPVWLSWEGDNTKQTVSPNLTYTCSTKTLTAANFKGHLAGNADTATHAEAANNVNNLGNKTAIEDGTIEPNGLYLYKCYNNGYPTAYGNVISIGGLGGGELLAGWSGNNKGIEHLYYRNRRDNTALWSDWRTVAFTSDINSYAPTKTGSGASGTWPINISGTATNADKLDGYHASDLFRHLGGNQTPVITDIFDRAGTIDLSAMSDTNKTTAKANINKSKNSLQNIWVPSYGIYAYGGDLNMANGFNTGSIKLTQSYKNFDKILIVGTSDDGTVLTYKLWDVWELSYAFANSSRFYLFSTDSMYWFMWGTTRKGTTTNALSTDTIWNSDDQNCGLVAIYGIKY